MPGDVYPGLLLLALIDVTPDRPLCDMNLCGHDAAVQRGTYRVCLEHGLLMPREGSSE